LKAAVPLALLALLSVAGCDKPKPRPAAAAAMAAAAVGTPQMTPAASIGLTRRAETAIFSLDMINASADPLNNPARIKAGVPTTMTGFGFDPVARTAPKAIDVVIDGVPYGTACCHERQDVAGYYETEAVQLSGFRVTLPAGVVTPGAHKVMVRAVAADGASFFDSVPLSFTAE